MAGGGIAFVFKILARNPPSICFVISAFFAFLAAVVCPVLGISAPIISRLWQLAIWSFWAGVALQVLWIASWIFKTAKG